MKTPQTKSKWPRERGSATVVFIALLGVMLILVAATSQTIFQLHAETKLLERRQIKRLNLSQTNAATAVPLPATPETQ